MSAWRVYLGVARLRFLLLSVVCVLLAAVLAARQLSPGLDFLLDLALVLPAALMAHVGVNALNEYCDYRSGLDLCTRRTPFSGGSGTLVDAPAGLPVALWGGCGSLALCIGAGGALMLRHPEQALAMLLPGLAGILLVILYTPVLTRHPWWCLAAPGAGFGLCMLPGAVLALGGRLDVQVLACGLILGFLCNNLLLINQLPDVDADHQTGRRTLAMLLGVRGVARLVLAQWLLAALLVAVCLPASALLVLLLLPLAIRVWRGLPLLQDAQPQGWGVMANNVILTLAVPLLLALALGISSFR